MILYGEGELMKVQFGFVYNYCNDVNAIRQFYGELLGMEEVSFKNEDDSHWNWVIYKSGEVQFLFFQLDQPAPTVDGWAMLPGPGQGDLLPTASYSVTGLDEAKFKQVYQSSKEMKIKANPEVPTWRQDSYWGLTLKDPSGRTIEVCWEPQGKPSETTWT